jgi:Recombination endonuclease VII
MPNPDCARCGKKLSKPRLEARKRKCYLCEVATRREGRQKAHDRNVESEDFTAADYWMLYERQGGTCAVYSCRAKGKSKALAVEHDHSCEMGHDRSRWCRLCVRGLTCTTHNEWIGRTGDDPDIFDSLASYLRNPPARKVLMDRMIVGTDVETISTLNKEYKIPFKRGKHMLDIARGVGPSPVQVPGGTIIVRYIRIPRTAEVLYEIIETAPRMDHGAALAMLMGEYGLTERRAKSMLNAAWDKGNHRATTPDGIVRITYHGRGPEGTYLFSVER